MDVKDIQVANETKCANGANNEDWCEAWLRGGFSIRYLNALSKYHRADAYDGATLFDGDGVVVGHAFGELAE